VYLWFDDVEVFVDDDCFGVVCFECEDFDEGFVVVLDVGVVGGCVFVGYLL